MSTEPVCYLPQRISTKWRPSLLFVLIVYGWKCCLSLIPNDCPEAIQDEIRSRVSVGQLSTARWMALQELHQSPNCQSTLAETYVKAFDDFVSNHPDSYLSIAKQQDTAHRRNIPPHDDGSCLPAIRGYQGNVDPNRDWDACCSMLPSLLTGTIYQDRMGPGDPVWSSFSDEAHTVVDSPTPWSTTGVLDVDKASLCCCEMQKGSFNHWRLPALQEPALAVRIRMGLPTTKLPNSPNTTQSKQKVLELEQDGYLRLFDVSTTLWPSGYLLTLCMADPGKCQLVELQQSLLEFNNKESYDELSGPIAVELGTGIGAPSIALTLYLDTVLGRDDGNTRVVATDMAPQALALATANAHTNDARSVSIVPLNHTSTDDVEAIRNRMFPSSGRRGFAVVMGSSLQSLFENSNDPTSHLWKVLDTLLDPYNPHAVGVFAHVRSSPLMPPTDGSFQLERRVSGDQYGMETRWGHPSDFEIAIFRRGTSYPKENT